MATENTGSADKERSIVEQNYRRYLYGKDAHRDYVDKAKRNEDFYFGDGSQWSEADRQALLASGRYIAEFNEIQGKVDTIIGQQLSKQVDIAYKPRNKGQDELTAEALSKVAKFFCDENQYSYKESLIHEDGRIEQRGFMEFRVEIGEDNQAKVVIDVLDPRDCIPDPDATSYDPRKWSDFIKMRWMSYDDLVEDFGKKLANEVKQRGYSDNETEEDQADRNRFGGEDVIDFNKYDYTDNGGVRRFLVIDRQHKKRVQRDVAIDLATGKDVFLEDLRPEEQANIKAAGNHVLAKKSRERIRWTVTCGEVLLHDEWSPYRTIDVVMYAPRFRRGRTQGDVDNLVSPQETYNKLISQEVTIVNGTANSGWMFEEGSLVDMTRADLAEVGAKSGLVIEYKEGKKPSKIDPNKVPTGLDRMIDRTKVAIDSISGIDKPQMGIEKGDLSGEAYKALQYAGGMQRARSMNNLEYTRDLGALKLLELIQDFITEERIFTITDADKPGDDRFEEVAVNQVTIDGIVNDLSVGEYDVVTSETSTHHTFMDTQYRQAMEMRKEGVPIPDTRLIEMSSITKKNEIISEMRDNQAPTEDPKAEADAELSRAKGRLTDAQTEKVKAETVSTKVESLYEGIQTANVIAATPATAGIGDDIMASAGYQDMDQPPIYPGATGGMSGEMTAGDLPPNTNPQTPAPMAELPDATTGVARGIETQRTEA